MAQPRVCLTLLVGCVHTALMYQMAGLKSVSTGAFGLDFSLFIIVHHIAVLLFKKNASWVSYQSTIKTSGEVSKCFGQQWAGVKGAFLRFICVFLCFIFFAKSQSVLNYVHHFLSSYGYRNSSVSSKVPLVWSSLKPDAKNILLKCGLRWLGGHRAKMILVT